MIRAITNLGVITDSKVLCYIIDGMAIIFYFINLTREIRKSEINLSLLVKSGDLDSIDFELLKSYKKTPNQKEIREQIIERDLILVEKIREGDLKSRNALFLKHTPFLRRYLHDKFNPNPEDFDLLLSECFMGYIEYCLPSFDSTIHRNFLNHLRRSLDAWFINDWRYKERHKIDTISYDELDENENEENFTKKDKYLKTEDRNLGWIENN